jgi:Glyoxalase/Bleomycin resistance protein/Dioxygenase superfamily
VSTAACGSDGFMNAFYHAAVLVTDLEEAIEHFRHLYGLTFPAPVEITARARQRGGSDASMPCRLTYSMDGPMHVELFEAHGDGLWSVANASAIHHIGMWSTDPQARADQMLAQGCEWEASLYFDSATAGIIFVRDRAILVELVGESLRAPWEALVGIRSW